MQMDSWKARKPRTFGVRNNDTREGSSPVSDLNGEISLLVLELIEPNHLPRGVSTTGQCKAQ
jgi:hypothetical protein